MGLINWAVKKIATKLTEGFPVPGQVDKDDWMFRKISKTGEKEKLDPVAQEQMQRIAEYLDAVNPLAHRLLEITKDFIVGDGFSFQANDESVKSVLTKFWADPDNHLDLKQHTKAHELGLYGEQCYQVFVNKFDGRVKLGDISPRCIKEVLTDPDNKSVATHVVLNGTEVGGGGGKKLKIIRLDEDPDSNTFGKLVGECFFFTINKLSSGTRGRSDLHPLFDWLDAHEQFLFNRLDRAALINNFVWDVTLDGMDNPAIKEWLKSNPIPKPGSLRAHNERVTWKAVVPDMKSQDASIDARLIKNYILGYYGYPEHWFADGGNANRATAGEMSEPAIKKLKSRQAFFQSMLDLIFRFVIDQAVITDKVDEKADRSFTITASEISSKDLGRFATALKDTVAATTLAEQAGLMTQEKAIRIIDEIVSSFLGVDSDQSVQEEIEELDEESEIDNAIEKNGNETGSEIEGSGIESGG